MTTTVAAFGVAGGILMTYLWSLGSPVYYGISIEWGVLAAPLRTGVAVALVLVSVALYPVIHARRLETAEISRERVSGPGRIAVVRWPPGHEHGYRARRSSVLHQLFGPGDMPFEGSDVAISRYLSSSAGRRHHHGRGPAVRSRSTVMSRMAPAAAGRPASSRIHARPASSSPLPAQQRLDENAVPQTHHPKRPSSNR